MPEINNPLLMFLHLPKTAGNTVLDVFAQNYLFKRMAQYYPELGTTPEQWMKKNWPVVSKSEVLFGHFPYGVENLMPVQRPVVYCTLLRDPIRRTISYYHFARKHPAHYLHNEVIKMSLIDFVASGICSEIDNGQTRQLAGWDAMERGKCTEADYSLARAHLESMAVVGVQERFDESILVMREKFGWSGCFYTSKNVGRKPSRVDEAVLEQIREANIFDVQLYHTACERLEREMMQIEGFDRSLQRFRSLNRSLGRIGRPIRSLCVPLAVRRELR